MAQKKAQRKKSVKRDRKPMAQETRQGMILIMAVVLVLVTVLIVQSRHLSARNQTYEAQIASLEMQMTEEEDRSEKIEDFRDYTRTDTYAEKMAREKFGLVYPDEVIFKPES
jgi:cell division protein FtsB